MVVLPRPSRTSGRNPINIFAWRRWESIVVTRRPHHDFVPGIILPKRWGTIEVTHRSADHDRPGLSWSNWWGTIEDTHRSTDHTHTGLSLSRMWGMKEVTRRWVHPGPSWSRRWGTKGVTHRSADRKKGSSWSGRWGTKGVTHRPADDIDSGPSLFDKVIHRYFEMPGVRSLACLLGEYPGASLRYHTQNSVDRPRQHGVNQRRAVLNDFTTITEKFCMPFWDWKHGHEQLSCLAG